MQEFRVASNLDEAIYCKELTLKVQSLLDQLTPRQQEIFRLSRKEGLSHEEIATKLDISVNTVKKHMSNTLVSLKSSLVKYN